MLKLAEIRKEKGISQKKLATYFITSSLLYKCQKFNYTNHNFYN